MKILAEETVVRYHVEYDELETDVLKIIGWLPPTAEARARLWVTTTEIEEFAWLLAKAKEGAS